ncbi:hypothetical protein GCK72_006970 [Caenorhabditis remanei]|uniref:Uncharacterized protein n=1 Tax=Caenorhabditis remanei TaxID=31234 RepID=E3M1J4_CAERE|nr:hypothetical protein GCK72_006970 [Caenorhabditis remanei]EFO88625.1 hypothetical protein CRE_06561 [Caenorhabditis remanei]KAF1767012.1 hypothetical protein GCK72_006970 [Caenorhabditis remanei]
MTRPTKEERERLQERIRRLYFTKCMLIEERDILTEFLWYMRRRFGNLSGRFVDLADIFIGMTTARDYRIEIVRERLTEARQLAEDYRGREEIHQRFDELATMIRSLYIR